MNVRYVSERFNEIEASSSRNKKIEILASLFKTASPSEAKILCYLSLGELYPPYKNSLFSIAEKSMIPIVARLLQDSQESILIAKRTSGDLGAVIQAGSWIQGSLDISLLHLYSELASIQNISGTGSQEAKAEKIFGLLGDLDPLSAKYVVRIILGKLRLGFSDMTIIDALSWMDRGNKSLKKELEHAYNTCVDIGLIAQTVKQGGIQAIQKMHINIGVPIRPAAAERLPSAEAIFNKIGPAVAQLKLDGFRLQIHLDKRNRKSQVYFFSRNLHDMSEMFPDLVAAIEQLEVETLICEGEAICYNAETQSFLPFQETVKRKRKHGIEEAASAFPLKLFLFDLLYLNGVSMLDVPHEERYHRLKKIVGAENQASPLQYMQEKKVDSADDLENYFQEAIQEGLEGLIVKKMDAVYQPGKRNFNWIKLKRHESGNLLDSVDGVILGYYYGSGKRASFGIGALLVGVYDSKHDQFQTIAKVGTGLSDAAWIEMAQKLKDITVLEKPMNVECRKNVYPDVWVSPEIVCEIIADEITTSPMHTAGYSDHEGLGYGLRFPRFVQYRIDKSPEDATTVSEIKTMFANQKMR